MSPPYPVPHQTSAESTSLPTARTGPDWQAAFVQLSALHESQRRQAARTVHDRVAQAFAAIKMSAYLCLAEDDPQQVRQDLQQIMAMAEKTAQEVRSLEQSLRPPQLDSVSLESALRVEIEYRFNDATGIVPDLHIQPLPQSPSPDVAIGCVRILQCLFDAISAQPASAHLTVLLRESGSDGFVVHARVAWQAEDNLQRWPDAAWFPLAQAMAICVGGVLSTDAEDSQQTLQLSLPYRQPDASSTA